MARVQDYYQNRRDLGKSSMVAYLDAWLTERSGMNKALMAPEKQRDPAKLAEQEARIRKAIADLMRAKVSGSVEEVKIASKLAETYLRGFAQVTSTGATAAAGVTSSKIRGLTDLTGEDLRMRRRVGRELTPTNPDTYKVAGVAYKDSKASGTPIGPALVQKVKDVAKQYEGDDPSKKDAVAAMVLAQAEEAGDEEAVRALKKAFFGGEDADVDGYFALKYPKFTPEEHKAAREEIKKMGGGASTKGLTSVYEKLVADGAGGGGTRTSTSSGGSGAGVVPDSDKVLADLEAAADDLNAAWKAAAAAPARRFPRPNYMIANPNTYTNPREIQDLEKWGVLDSKYVEEVAAEKQSQGSWGGVVKAIGDREGISQQVERIAPLLLTNDEGVPETSPDAERRMIDAWTRREVAGDGGYRYTLNDDGTITSTKPGGKPVIVAKGSVPFKAIVDEIFAPGLLPDEVADLYAPARALAEDGRWAQVAERARLVDPNNVRSAYAQAIRDVATGRSAFEGVPAESQMEALATSIGEGGGKWGEHFRALLRQPIRDDYGKKRVMGAVEGLADSMDAAPAIEERLRAEDTWEAKHGLDEVIAGRDVGPEAYGRGKALGETTVKDLEGTSLKRVREAERTLELLDEWERKNPPDLSAKSRRDDPVEKAREGVAQTRLRLEREIAQVKSEAQGALPENVDVTLTELEAGRLGLRGDEALDAQRALEARRDALKAPKPRPVTYLEETRPPPEPGLSEKEPATGYAERGTTEPIYGEALEEAAYLEGLDPKDLIRRDATSYSLSLRQAEARALRDEGTVPEERTPEARGAALLRDRLHAERDRAAAAEAAAPRITPRAAAKAPAKSAPKKPPPVSAAKPPPGTFEDADLDALLSQREDVLFEDADLDALLSTKATK